MQPYRALNDGRAVRLQERYFVMAVRRFARALQERYPSSVDTASTLLYLGHPLFKSRVEAGAYADGIGAPVALVGPLLR